MKREIITIIGNSVALRMQPPRTYPINVENKRIEKQLLGIKKPHQEYTKIINDIVSRFNQSILETDELSSDEHYLDGLQYSEKEHAIKTPEFSHKVLSKIR